MKNLFHGSVQVTNISVAYVLRVYLYVLCADYFPLVTLDVRVFVSLRADLVPVYSFGENEAYKQVIFAEGSWWRQVQRRLQKLLGFAPCLFHGCGFFSSESWGMVPYCKPINTVGESSR